MKSKKFLAPLLFGLLLVFIVLDAASARLVHFFNLNLKNEANRLEKAYRIRSEHYHHDLLPNFTGDAFWGKRYRIQTNNLGFKDKGNRIVTLPSAGRRVLFIGDSFTEGVGFPYEKTFVGIVDQNLSRRGYEVLNAGVSSYSPTLYHSKIKYWIENKKLQVSEVFLFLDLSDITDEYNLTHPETQDSKEVPRFRLQSFIKQNSLLAHTFANYLYAWRNPFPMDHSRARWSYNPKVFQTVGAFGLKKATSSMNQLASFLRSHSIPLTVGIYPWPVQIQRRELTSIQVKHWTEWGKKNSVPILNLFPAFIQDGVEPIDLLKRYFIPGDVHWNESGHALVAKEVLKSFH